MKQMLLFSLFLGFALNVSAQKIEEREIDKFTKLETITTSSETLYTRNVFGIGKYQFKFYIKKQGTSIYGIFADIITPEPVKFSKGDGVKLLLDNGDVIYLQSEYIGISSSWLADLWLFETYFKLTKEDVEKLKNNNITDLRMTTTGVYRDYEIKPKKRDLVKKMLKLLDEITPSEPTAEP